MSATACRSGPGSGRTPSSGQCAASEMTSHPAGGPNATAISLISTRQSLASVCLSPDPPSLPRRGRGDEPGDPDPSLPAGLIAAADGARSRSANTPAAAVTPGPGWLAREQTAASGTGRTAAGREARGRVHGQGALDLLTGYQPPRRECMGVTGGLPVAADTVVVGADTRCSGSRPASRRPGPGGRCCWRPGRITRRPTAAAGRMICSTRRASRSGPTTGVTPVSTAAR